MKKNIIQRGLVGFPIGITIGAIITICISLYIGDGYFHPVVPEFIDTIGGELNAVIFQTALCGIMGTGYSMASIIWEIDSWSIAKQGGIYFLVACLIMFPIAYFTNWMEHSLLGVLAYSLIFVLIFIFVWLIQYFIWKIRVDRINEVIYNGDKE